MKAEAVHNVKSHFTIHSQIASYLVNNISIAYYTKQSKLNVNHTCIPFNRLAYNPIHVRVFKFPNSDGIVPL